MAASTLLAVTLGLYLFGAVWLLPAGNRWKSARSFCSELGTGLTADDQVSSYQLWDWRAEYAFYLGQKVRNLSGTEALGQYWSGEGRQLLIVEGEEASAVEQTLGVAPAAVHRIGGRKVYLFEKPAPGGN